MRGGDSGCCRRHGKLVLVKAEDEQERKKIEWLT